MYIHRRVPFSRLIADKLFCTRLLLKRHSSVSFSFSEGSCSEKTDADGWFVVGHREILAVCIRIVNATSVSRHSRAKLLVKYW